MQFKQQLIILLLGSTSSAFSQNVKPVRYKDFVFTDVTITKNQSYASGHTKKEKKAHLFDLYQPANDNATARPLIIWMHGGGFIFGTKEDNGMKIWSEDRKSTRLNT